MAPKAPKQPAAPKRKAPAPKPQAKRAPEIVTLRMAFEQLAETYAMPKSQAHQMAAELVELVKVHLTAGDRIRLTGLGTIVLKDRPAKLGRNLRTGETVQIPAGKRVAFSPAMELRRALSNGNGG